MSGYRDTEDTGDTEGTEHTEDTDYRGYRARFRDYRGYRGLEDTGDKYIVLIVINSEKFEETRKLTQGYATIEKFVR